MNKGFLPFMSFKKHCIKGHYLKKTRKITPKGKTYCSECKRLARRGIKGRIANYKDKYGITIADFNIIFKKQKNTCAICKCKKPIKYSTKGFVIDHNHKTGRIRGILCTPCNLILGHAQDSTKIIKAATKYLEKSK